MSLRPRLQRAALGGAFAGHLEEFGHTVAVFGGDCERSGAEDCIAHVGVEAAIVADLRLHLVPRPASAGSAGTGRDGELTPGGFLLLQPDFFGAEHGDLGTADQRRLLRVEAVLLEAAFGAVQQEAGRVVAGEVAGAAVGEHSFAILAGIVEGDVEGVLDSGLISVGADAGR